MLKLGLKPETADMVLIKELAYDEIKHCTYDADTYMIRPIEYIEGEEHRGHIPAWSLHRLMEIGNIESTGFANIKNAYDTCISIIASHIKFGLLNKKYLKP